MKEKVLLMRYQLHPIIFMLYALLNCYIVNYQVTPIYQAVIELLIGIIIISALWFIIYILIKDLLLSSILASAFVVWFFTFGHLFNAINVGLRGYYQLRLRDALPVYLIMGVILLIMILRTNQVWRRTLSKIFIVAGSFLILLTCLRIGNIIVHLKGDGQISHASISFTAIDSVKEINFNYEDNSRDMVPLKGNSRPDIYYLIVDAHTRSDILQEYFGYDNREFIHYLINKGFFVAERSCSNYPSTNLSIPSSMNMGFLKSMSAVNAEMVRQSAVGRFLREKGYRIIYIDSTGQIWDQERNYPENPVNHFYLLHGAFSESVLKVINAELWAPIYRKNILRVFSSLEKIIELKGPKFVFGHIPCPHPPMVFGERGEEIPLSERLFNLTGNSMRARYAKQVAYTDRKVTSLLNSLLSNPKGKPVVILQGDHGYGVSTKPLTPGKLPTTNYLRERMSIINAYYIPENRYQYLYSSITPVNSFRVLFNTIFGTKYELLKDKMYYVAPQIPDKYTDVTSIISGNTIQKDRNNGIQKYD